MWSLAVCKPGVRVGDSNEHAPGGPGNLPGWGPEVEFKLIAKFVSEVAFTKPGVC